jgi:hypothetical protein
MSYDKDRGGGGRDWLSKGKETRLKEIHIATELEIIQKGRNRGFSHHTAHKARNLELWLSEVECVCVCVCGVGRGVKAKRQLLNHMT